jgi:Ca2+-binding RTX toxin-like protein
MENLTGSNFNDTLTGNSANNMLTGLAGNDTLNGGNGNDTLQGDIGNDLLNGGDGIDTASYRTATAGVTVVLGEEGAQNTGGAGFDTLIDIETITGSNFNDALTLEFEGSNSFGVTTFNGGAGDDTLSDTRSPLVASEVIFNGGAGNDTLSASSGTLNGDEGNDSLSASETFATLNGGAGNDILG